MLRNNPRGWGNGAGPEPEIAYQDDGGNLYGFNNALLQKAPAPQQGFGDQSLTDMLIGIGSAPAKMATGLASGMSPYGSEGFQVPPLAGDAWEAINAPGKILNEGMTPEDRDRTATNAAGFMMGGGLVAPKPANALKSPALKSPAIREWERVHSAHPNKHGLYAAIDVGGDVFAGRSHIDAINAAYDRLGEATVDSLLERSGYGFVDMGGKILSREEAGRIAFGGGEIDASNLYSNGSKGGAGVGAAMVEGATNPTTIRMYHGTSGDGASSILKEGFKTNKVFFTRSPDGARNYGEHVIPIDVDKSKLLFDFDQPGQALSDIYGAREMFGDSTLQIYDLINKMDRFGVENRGSVFSPRTGETLFSNGSKPGAAIGNSLVESQQGIEDILQSYYGTPWPYAN